MFRKIYLLLIIPLVFSKECYWNSKDPYLYFGSKTPYDDVRGDIRDVKGISGCEVVNVWALLRHGNRHPGIDDIVVMASAAALKDLIIDNHAKGLGEMCAQDIADLKNWSWNYNTEETPSYLTETGFQEHVDLGTRFNEKFHDLLETLDEYTFRPSIEQRTRESARAFTQGLGQGPFVFDVSEPMEADEAVRPYKICPKYETEVKNSHQKKKNIKDYFNSNEFITFGKKLESHLGLNFSLNSDNITGLYELCRYYRSYSTIKRSPWCSAFSNHGLKIMEYSDDVRHYYRNGHGGAPITSNLGALVLKDLFQRFNSSKYHETKAFTGYFSHDTMLDMVYSALGLYWDYPKVAGFYRDPDRRWKTSFMVPFAANIVAVMYRCQTEGVISYKVKFLINEIEIPLCKSWACEWEEFVEKIGQFAQSNIVFCSL